MKQTEASDTLATCVEEKWNFNWPLGCQSLMYYLSKKIIACDFMKLNCVAIKYLLLQNDNLYIKVALPPNRLTYFYVNKAW